MDHVEPESCHATGLAELSVKASNAHALDLPVAVIALNWGPPPPCTYLMIFQEAAAAGWACVAEALTGTASAQAAAAATAAAAAGVRRWRPRAGRRPRSQEAGPEPRLAGLAATVGAWAIGGAPRARSGRMAGLVPAGATWAMAGSAGAGARTGSAMEARRSSGTAALTILS